MNNLETILIIYILLNWFLGIMVVVLPVRVLTKVIFIFIIICPPLIIWIIGELIKEKHGKRKKKKSKFRKEFDNFFKENDK